MSHERAGDPTRTEQRLRAIEADLRFQVELEALVTAVSTRFLGVHLDDLANVAEDALARLCEYFVCDRAYALKVSQNLEFELNVEWWRDGVEQRTTAIADLPLDARRAWGRLLRSGGLLHLPELDEVPEEYEPVVGPLREQGVRSILFVSMRAREQTVGFLGFEARRTTARWSDESIAMVRTVGELFVNAVERCRAEAALAEAARTLELRNAELERSNRELEQFASIVSHDLKSPLQVVRGFLELLGKHVEQREDSSSEARTYVGAALRGAARMDHLIDDLLAYSRAGRRPARYEAVDLSEIANEVLADSATAITAADGTVRIGSLPVVQGDSTQLRQLLQNLVTNALKFRRPGIPAEVVVGASEQESAWLLTVTDNGIGVPAEHRGEIFEMFSRLHHGDQPGSGIGLAICTRVAENHGGRIWVEDAPGGEGSCFCVSIAKSPV